ncbi:MAG: FAD-binding oxidoreductase, partial [Candidatus Kaiserbacteria bacterium]|nr:FAD-binding oxidoreductase [Candidatus Kaiserbacteria bacterium]
EAFIDEHLSQAEPVFENQWTGQILEPIDGLAMIGQFGSRYLYVAMGFSGNGMTYGTIAAKMFTDHVMGDGSPYSTLYDPARIPDLKDLYIKGRDYVQEFFGGAVKNAVTYDDN